MASDLNPNNYNTRDPKASDDILNGPRSPRSQRKMYSTGNTTNISHIDKAHFGALMTAKGEKNTHNLNNTHYNTSTTYDYPSKSRKFTPRHEKVNGVVPGWCGE